jgi:acetoin:2,6-dichlorophenolindophenol oxidoreductase subunit beta
MDSRRIKYVEALSEGLVSAMEVDPSIFVTGIAADYSSGFFGSTTEALKRFGPERVFDAPAMENALTGIAIGAAVAGKRPVIVHPRVDFMFLAFDQLINLAAKWRYMFGGNTGHVPIVVRAVIGKGWGQGATHSQSLHSVLGHFPGLHVVMPGTPKSALELTLAALKGNTPTVILEHRALYDVQGDIPVKALPAEIGQAEILREGEDVTIVATSLMAQESLKAAEYLASKDISAEVIDPRWIRPLDEKSILKSVRKTGRLIAVDVSWELYGFASEVSALAAEKAFEDLKSPVLRISLADTPAPVSHPLEEVFYPHAQTIVAAVYKSMGLKAEGEIALLVEQDNFKGPY